MAITSARYYSTDPTDPLVYHDYSDCPNGQRIKPENKRWGDNGYDRCGSCERMD